MRQADPWAALRGLRIGCVKYLNSRPLICAYEGKVEFEHPSVLARMLAADELDVALVPVFEVLRDPRYLIVDDAAVACDGPVFSVFLAYRGDLRGVRSVSTDPASLSSLHLLKALLAEFHGIRPAFGEHGEARLLIGNQAIEFRLAENDARGGWNFMDLGEEWKRCTGLPFVFAVWAMRPGMPAASAVADALREAKARGVARIPELIAAEDFADRETRSRYLTQHLRFEIGPDGKKAIGRFRELLVAEKLIAPSQDPLKFI